jgi:hypothetical protein
MLAMSLKPSNVETVQHILIIVLKMPLAVRQVLLSMRINVDVLQSSKLANRLALLMIVILHNVSIISLKKWCLK